MSEPFVRMIERLAANATLEALGVEHIRPVLGWESDSDPFIVFAVEEADRVLGLSSAAATYTQQIRLDCYASGYQTAWQVARAVEASLTHWTDDIGDVWEWVEGPIDADVMVFEGSDARRLYHVTLAVRLHYTIGD